MKRSPLKRRTRMGQASRRRIQAGGKLAVGRQSASRAGWAEIKRRVRGRSHGRCEVVVWAESGAGSYLRCVRLAVDAHHIVKRSQGGADSIHNVMDVCRQHHDQFDAPYIKGRLVYQGLLVIPKGSDDFCYICEIIRADSKFSLR